MFGPGAKVRLKASVSKIVTSGMFFGALAIARSGARSEIGSLAGYKTCRL
jgi:hypothetical protein